VGTRCADHVTPLYPQKLALTSPTGGGRSVGIVRVRTKATEVACFFVLSDSGRLKERTKRNANFHAPCSFVDFVIELVTLTVKLNMKNPFLSCASFGTIYRIYIQESRQLHGPVILTRGKEPRSHKVQGTAESLATPQFVRLRCALKQPH